MTPLHRLESGVFLGSHAVSEGWVSRRRLQTGPFRRLVQNVYADVTLPYDHALKARGVALLLPELGALSGRSAACWYGAPFASVSDAVLVVVPEETDWRGPRGVQVHRTAVPVGQLAAGSTPVPMTTARRTAWDVAVFDGLHAAVAMLDAMVRAGHVTRAELRELERSGRGTWGSRRVARAFGLVDGLAGSPQESVLRVAMTLAGLPPPVAQFEIRTASGDWLGVVDFAWPEQRVVVEYEGAYHFDGLQIARDDVRYAALVAEGWRVLRVSHADMQDLPGLVERIRQLLGD